MKVTKPCLICGKDFESYDYYNEKFCSRKCYYQHRKGLRYSTKEATCDLCHKKFIRSKSLIDKGKNNFCSWKCKKKFMKGKPRTPHIEGCQCVVCTGGQYWLGKKRDPEMVERTRQKQLGTHPSLKTRKKMSDTHKKLPPEFYRKCMINSHMSKLEMKTLELLEINHLPYFYVGLGSYKIGIRNPDFIHATKKIAVEVFYKRQKEKFKNGGYEGWRADRINYFTKYGWHTILMDVKIINSETVARMLGDEVEKLISEGKVNNIMVHKVNEMSHEDGMIEFECAQCHCNFYKYASQVSNPNNAFCSKECSDLSMEGKPKTYHGKDCQCIACKGKGYWKGKKRNKETVEKIRNTLKDTHPTDATRQKMSDNANPWNKNQSKENNAMLMEVSRKAKEDFASGKRRNWNEGNRDGQVTLPCEVCSKEFTRCKAEIANKKHHFCSKACFHSAMRGKKTKLKE